MGQHIGSADGPVHAQQLKDFHIFRISYGTDGLFHGKQALCHLAYLQVIRVLLPQRDHNIASADSGIFHHILLAGIAVDHGYIIVNRCEMLTVTHILIDRNQFMFSH